MSAAGRPRPARLLVGLALALLLLAGFAALGLWQVERRAWKLDLIERVEARVAAAPVAPPPPEDWPTLSREDAEYLRVALAGRWGEGEALVQALTARGAGVWLLAPFVTDGGPTVLVNRGFVPAAERAAPRPAPEGPVTGLLRLSEPGGGFLRSNDPAAGRWFSRDVEAIAAALGLGPGPGEVAPFFVDAEAGRNGGPPGLPPIGGLTVVSFRNSHLVYALTWFALAAMSLLAALLLLRRRRGAEAEP